MEMLFLLQAEMERTTVLEVRIDYITRSREQPSLPIDKQEKQERKIHGYNNASPVGSE
jgi:hypothetical protein